MYKDLTVFKTAFSNSFYGNLAILVHKTHFFDSDV